MMRDAKVRNEAEEYIEVAVCRGSQKGDMWCNTRAKQSGANYSVVDQGHCIPGEKGHV